MSGFNVTAVLHVFMGCAKVERFVLCLYGTGKRELDANSFKEMRIRTCEKIKDNIKVNIISHDLSN